MPPYRSKKIRDPIDVLRVRFWYEGVRNGICYSDAKQLELHFWPQEDPDFKEKDPPGKWARYKLGKNTPILSLISRVDREVGGSAKEINHPLWRALNLKDKDINNIYELFKELDQEVIKIVFRSTSPTPQLHQSFSLTLCQRLVRLGNLDSLTALLLFWHKAQKKRKVDQTQYLARFIFDILLIIGNEFWLRGLIKEFFEVFRTNIFEKTNWFNSTFAMNHQQYLKRVQLLSRLPSHVNDLGYINSLEKEHQLKGQLLTDAGWIHVQLVLGIRLQSNSQEEPPTK